MNIKYLSNGFKNVDKNIRFSIPKALKVHLKNKYQIKSFLFVRKRKIFAFLCRLF